MEPFTTHEGLVMPLDRRDVDTDQIIPQRFLRKIARTGFGPDLFANLRYQGDDKTPDPSFVLNELRYAGASILLARANFGCGSSREHAPWALSEYGFRVLIAPSFADIFANNCVNSGILTVALDEETVDGLFAAVERTEGYRLRVDLPSQTITTPDGDVIRFAIDSFRKESLLGGLDPIGRTLRYEGDISSYEGRRQEQAPWLLVGAQ
jgi:3-isopropylmalate/(R)-2-methylmalate dehydratase small subunit